MGKSATEELCYEVRVEAEISTRIHSNTMTTKTLTVLTTDAVTTQQPQPMASFNKDSIAPASSGQLQQHARLGDSLPPLNPIPTKVLGDFHSDDAGASPPECSKPPVLVSRCPNTWKPRMYTPQAAKEVSLLSPGVLIEVTTAGPHDRIQEEDACVKGMILRGFLNGLPLYYSVTRELLAIQTETITGVQYVTQPIETCFGKRKVENAGDHVAESDSGYCTEPKTTENTASLLPPNRTFSNDWFKVDRSSISGFGVFATVEIPKGTHILLEQPMLTTKQYRFLEREYHALNEEEKKVFDGLHGYHKRDNDPLQRIWNANSFFLGGSEGLFAIATNFNHACPSRRNTQYRYDSGRQVMTFTATEAIAKGQEILISYASDRRHLYENFGFVCQCGGCDDQEWEPERSSFWDQF